MGVLVRGYYSQEPSFEVNEAGDFDVTRTVGAGGPSYAGLRLNSDGSADGNNNDGSASFASPIAVDDWLSSGSPSAAYVERTIVTGSADWLDDIGSSRVALSSNPRIGATRTGGGGGDTLVVTFNFYESASGGSPVGTITAVQIVAATTP